MGFVAYTTSAARQKGEASHRVLSTGEPKVKLNKESSIVTVHIPHYPTYSFQPSISYTSTMSRRTSTSPSTLAAATLILLASLQTVAAHFSIVYPAWRGNTLLPDRQWDYPCGGQRVTTNRTKWPIDGGALSIIPGWNAGHPTSFFYINMGYGTAPPNMTNIMVPVFQITAPSRDPFPGHFCLPDLPLPRNATVKVGDNATVQVIQVALHGASLYNCADITFVERGQEDPIPEGMCTNSSTIGFNLVYSTTSDSLRAVTLPSLVGVFALVAAVAQWVL